MKIFIASPNINTIILYLSMRPEAALNLLLSYGSEALESFLNDQHSNIWNQLKCIFLDSGTWALNNGGKNPHKIRMLNLEAYTLFLKRFGHLFMHYANFDEEFSNDDISTNTINQNSLEKEDFSPIPVVHDIYGDEIETLIDHGYDYIALGSSQISTRKSMEKVMRRFEGTGIRIHLFGCTKFDFIANYPIYSCDSSGWAGATSFGFVNYWNEEKSGLNKKDKIYLSNRIGLTAKDDIFNYKFKHQFIQFIQNELEIDFTEFLSNQQLQYVVNIEFVVRMEKAVNEIHRQKEFFTAE